MCLVITLCILQCICVPCILSLSIPSIGLGLLKSFKRALGETPNKENSAKKRILQALRKGAHWSMHPTFPIPAHAAASATAPVTYEWGSYRPGVYFGLKQITQMAPAEQTSDHGDGGSCESCSKISVPVSAVTGFMWGTQHRRGKVQLRHNTEGGKMAQVSKQRCGPSPWSGSFQFSLEPKIRRFMYWYL